MSKGMSNYISQRNAEAEAAKIIAEAIDKARAVLKKAGVEDLDDAIAQI